MRWSPNMLRSMMEYVRRDGTRLQHEYGNVDHGPDSKICLLLISRWPLAISLAAGPSCEIGCAAQLLPPVRSQVVVTMQHLPLQA